MLARSACLGTWTAGHVKLNNATCPAAHVALGRPSDLDGRLLPETEQCHGLLQKLATPA